MNFWRTVYVVQQGFFGRIRFFFIHPSNHKFVCYSFVICLLQLRYSCVIASLFVCYSFIIRVSVFRYLFVIASLFVCMCFISHLHQFHYLCVIVSFQLPYSHEIARTMFEVQDLTDQDHLYIYLYQIPYKHENTSFYVISILSLLFSYNSFACCS